MTAPDPNAEWWTTSDVAAYLGVTRSAVSQYRTDKRMPQPKTVGRTHMWKPAAIIEWNANRPGRGNWRRP